MTDDLSRAEVKANIRVLALIELQIIAEIAIDDSFCKTFIVSVICVKQHQCKAHHDNPFVKPEVEANIRVLAILEFQVYAKSLQRSRAVGDFYGTGIEELQRPFF